MAMYYLLVSFRCWHWRWDWRIVSHSRRRKDNVLQIICYLHLLNRMTMTIFGCVGVSMLGRVRKGSMMQQTNQKRSFGACLEVLGNH